MGGSGLKLSIVKVIEDAVSSDRMQSDSFDRQVLFATISISIVVYDWMDS